MGGAAQSTSQSRDQTFEREPESDGTPASPGASADVVDLVWQIFASVRLAVGLILAIALLGLVSVVLPQTPAGLAPGTPEYADWLDLARPAFGPLTDALAALQLFSATGSLWMRLLLSALAVNTLVCTLNRLPAIWRTVFHPVVATDDATFDSAVAAEGIDLAQDSLTAARAVASALGQRRLRVAANVGETSYLHADRNHLFRLGTLLTHLAIILFLVGAVTSSLLGIRVPAFAVPEGSTRAVGLGTDLALRLETFSDEYYPDGPPKDYRSEVVLLDRDVEVARRTVRVNEPLDYGGFRFLQSGFGPAVVLRVADEHGSLLFEDGVALSRAMRDRPLGAFELPDRRLVIYVLAPALGQGDSELSAGQVRVGLVRDGQDAGDATLTQGQPAQIAGLTFTMVRERQYSAFEIVSDPGAPIIWIASALLVLGLSATFYFPDVRLRIRVRPAGPDRSEVVVAVAGPRGCATTSEITALKDTLSGSSAK